MLRILRFIGMIGVVVGVLIPLDASAQKGGGGGGRGGGGGGGGRSMGGGGGRSMGGGFSSASSFRGAPSGGMRSPSFNSGFNARSFSSANQFAAPSRGAWNGSSVNNWHTSNWNTSNWHNNNWHNGNWNSWNWNHNHHHHNFFWPYFAFGFFGNGFGYPFGWFPSYYGGYGAYAALGNSYDSPDLYYRSYPPAANQDLLTPMAAADGSATIEAMLPDPDAKLWVDGKETVSRGATRRYATPPLQAGYKYMSTIRAAWQKDGEIHMVERQVPLSANGRVVVDFTQSPSRVITGPYNRE
jgi:uncharacterized protein (TIGR03000 family)